MAVAYRSTPGRSISTASEVPRDGGTLLFLGPGDPDHLEAVSAYHLRTGQLLRAITRQLFAYPASGDVSEPSAAFEPAADVAAEVPTRLNGGISGDGLTYTIRLRKGVRWDTSPPREVTAHDFVRGLKRIANPLVGADARHYFTDTILGMQEYCDDYDRAFKGARPDAADIARFQNSREVAGLRAEEDGKLVITLRQPANDFLNILALGCASAAPREYDDYLPDSPEFVRNLSSNGPYRISSVEPGNGEMILGPNPVWSQETDPIRRRHVNAVRIRRAARSAEVRRQLLDSGELDLAWPFAVVSWAETPPEPDDFPRCHPGFTLNPYLVFNLVSPNAGGAVRNINVRRAIASAIDKAAIGSIFNALEGVATTPLHSAIPRGSVGHREYNPYPTPGDRGDAARARALLSEAGYGGGLTLVAAVREAGLHRSVMRSVASDLEKAGVRLVLESYGQAEYYGSLLSDPTAARRGAWDIAEPGWTPDWFGNNGRATLRPLFRTDDRVGTSNYGCYSNPKVDRLIEQALGEGSPARAEQLWHEVDAEVMNDLPVVPLLAFACQSCAARVGAAGWGTWLLESLRRAGGAA